MITVVTFNGERLSVLRRFHNLTTRELGAQVGVSGAAITKFERSAVEPSDITLHALAEVLKVRPDFFHNSASIDRFDPTEMNFRSRQAATQRMRKKVTEHGTFFGMVLHHMSDVIAWPRLRLPRVILPPFGSGSERELKAINEALERAAENCRNALGVGVDAPIENVTMFAEHAGIVTTTLDESASEKIDACSRYGETNLVVINPARKSATRRRFDLAHEIGHGVIVGHIGPKSDDEREHAERERQAEYFAGALLMPREAFAREFWNLGRSPAWPHVYDMKRRWGVHFDAMIYRAHQLGVMDSADYARRYKYMSKMGWRSVNGVEPAERPFEQSQLFGLGFARYRKETSKTWQDMAADLDWSEELFRKVVGETALAASEPPQERLNVSSLDAFRQRKLSLG